MQVLLDITGAILLVTLAILCLFILGAVAYVIFDFVKESRMMRKEQ